MQLTVDASQFGELEIRLNFDFARSAGARQKDSKLDDMDYDTFMVLY